MVFFCGRAEYIQIHPCIREINEEIDFPIDISSFYLIAIIQDAENLGVQLLTEVGMVTSNKNC